MIQEFEQLWGKPVFEELKELIRFQEEESGFEYYSQGFGVGFDDKNGLKYGWCDNPEFLAKLYPFAQANGTGSTYAFWDDGSGREMSDMPVVVFGDEGGECVVANHFGELLQLLTFDTEIYVDWDDCSFCKDEDDYEESPDKEAFCEWFEKHYSHLPLVDSEEQADEIIKKAQRKHQQKFNDWLSSFGIEITEYNPDEED